MSYSLKKFYNDKISSTLKQRLGWKHYATYTEVFDILASEFGVFIGVYPCMVENERPCFCTWQYIVAYLDNNWKIDSRDSVFGKRASMTIANNGMTTLKSFREAAEGAIDEALTKFDEIQKFTLSMVGDEYLKGLRAETRN